MRIHHALFKQAGYELGLTTDDIVEVHERLGGKITGYFNRIEIYTNPWTPFIIDSIIYLNKIKKDGTKSKVHDCAFGPFKEINILNHE